MAMKKGYKGYKSYEYLEAGVDFPWIEPAEEYNEFEPYLIELTPAEEEKAAEIEAKYPIISMHEHINTFPKDITRSLEYANNGRVLTAYEGMAASNLDAVFDNLLDGVCFITSKHGWKWDDVIYDLGMRCCDIAHQDFLIKCGSVDDILRAKKEGKIAWIPTIEGAAMIENELDRIDMLYGFGVRLMGLTYSEANGIGCGIKEEHDGGLTKFGEEVVDRMNRIGMAIDLSHVGEQTAADAIAASTKPILITHTGARSLWPSKRLKTDEVMKACAEKGGVIGVEAAPHTTLTPNNLEHNIEGIMEHFEYIKNLVGIDHVSFGPDTTYGDHVGLHNAAAKTLSLKQVQSAGGASFPHVKYVKGMENPTEAYSNIVRWLVKHGYAEEDIAKVIGGNTLRALREIW